MILGKRRLGNFLITPNLDLHVMDVDTNLVVNCCLMDFESV